MLNKVEGMKKEKKKTGDNFFVVACEADLFKLQDEKKVKNVLVGGEVIMTYLNSQDEPSGFVGAVKQPRRLADGNLIARTKAHLDVYVPTPVIGALKEAGALASSYFSCDFALKWIINQSRVNHSFTLYICYSLPNRVLVETYIVTSRKVTDYSLRQFPGGEMYLGQLLHMSDHHDHPYFVASPGEVPGRIPDEVRDVSASVFKGRGRRTVVGSHKKRGVGKYVAPALVVAGAAMSFPAVNILYSEQLSASQAQLQGIISGIEDTYYSGGQQVAKLERQQYFLESAKGEAPENTQIATTILSGMTELRFVPGVHDPVLKAIRLPANIEGWDFEVTLQVGAVPGMNNTEVSEFVAKHMATFMSGELVAMGSPASSQGVDGKSVINLQYMGRLDNEVHDEY